jgi:methionyl-tRNA formyltransferase
VVVGTRKLNREIFTRCRLGALNLHTGILPYYRGADSEFWALYNGERDKIGVSVHFIEEELDTGDVIITEKQVVTERDDHRSLRMKNLMLGAEVMVRAIDLIGRGDHVPVPQDEKLARTYYSASPEKVAEYERKRNEACAKELTEG